MFLESEKVGAVRQDKQNAHVDSALRAFYSLSSSSLSLSVSSKCGHGSNLLFKMSMRIDTSNNHEKNILKFQLETMKGFCVSNILMTINTFLEEAKK